MAPGKVTNLARMFVSGTPGTGNITLGAAVAGCITFAASGVLNGEVVSYGIDDGANSEVGTAIYSSTGPTLTSRTPTNSTNGNALIAVTSSAQVMITNRSEDFVARGGDVMTGNLSIAKTGAVVLGLDSSDSARLSLDFAQNSLMRWQWMVETAAGNAAFFLTRYNPAGTFVDTPFVVENATGRITVNGDPVAALGIATKQYVDTKQPLDATLTALAALNSTAGMLEQTGADAFTKRSIGTASSAHLLTTGDGDGRYATIAQNTAKVSKTGDTMTGPLTLQGANLTINGGANGSGAPFTLSNRTRTGADVVWQALGTAAANDLTLNASGVLTTAVKGHQFGNPGGTAAAGALVSGDANILFYNFGTNWAGVGTDSNGYMWFRTGTSGTASAAFYLDTGRNGFFQGSITVALQAVVNSTAGNSAPNSGAIAAPNGSVTGRGAWFGLSTDHYTLAVNARSGYGSGMDMSWDTTGGYYGFIIKQLNSGGNGYFNLYIRDDGAVMGSIVGTVSGVAFNTTSDAALKENIRPAREVIDTRKAIMGLRVRHYSARYDPLHTEVGLVAQEANESLPGIVTPPQTMVTRDPETGEEGTHESPWQVAYPTAVPYMIDHMQQMQDQIDAMGAMVNPLQARVAELEERIATLERRLNQ